MILVYADIGWDFIAGYTNGPTSGKARPLAEDYSTRKIATSVADVHLICQRLSRPYHAKEAA